MATLNDAGAGDLAGGAEALEQTFERIGTLSRGVSAELVRGLKAAVSNGRELDSVLQSAALRLSAKVLDQALAPISALMSGGLASLTGLGASSLGGLFQARLGAAIGGGRVRPFASGGVLAAPTFFPMRGGVGLAGEAGAEAILPLARGADGRLGVRTTGGGVPSVVFNVTTPDAESFRRSEAHLAGLLARTVARGRRAL